MCYNPVLDSVPAHNRICRVALSLSVIRVCALPSAILGNIDVLEGDPASSVKGYVTCASL